MKRFAIAALALALGSAACSSSSTSPSTTKPTFTADLRTTNEVPPISNAEAGGSGQATITFDVTKDAAGNVTGGTATFQVLLNGFPAGTPINIAHIHQAAAGSNGSVVFSTSLSAGEVVLTNGSGSFTKSGIAPADPAIIQQIINNPSGFYFNAHSSLNPGGVVRGQLVKVQ
jgi:CHRD domain-containing protein